MDIVFLIGRILFGALFIGSAIGHLTQAEAMAGYAGSKGVPSPKLATQASGVLILLGALMVILGIWADLGSLFLLVFLVPTAVLMHAFWKETDPQGKQMEMIAFNKDLALAGAALICLYVFTRNGGDVPFTVVDGLF